MGRGDFYTFGGSGGGGGKWGWRWGGGDGGQEGGGQLGGGFHLWNAWAEILFSNNAGSPS